MSEDDYAEYDRLLKERDDVMSALLARFDPRYSFKEVSVGKGWWSLVLKLNDELAAIDPKYGISQVKEKFGGLRYYASPSKDYELSDAWEFDPFFLAIRYAENKSAVTCEECGEPGELRTGRRWIQTLCIADDVKAQSRFDKREAKLKALYKDDDAEDA